MATSDYTALLAIFYISFVTSVSAETLHIVTDFMSCQDTATDSDDVRCATLSQFALNSSSFTTSNITTITLTMDPGIHILDSTLSISNISIVELLSPPEDTMSIACNTTSPAFVFEDISSVHIAGMILRGCGEIVVSNVEDFIVQDCDFFAEEFEGAGLIVSETNGHIMNSEFSMYSSGALRVVDDSELIVSGCTFSQNQADVSAELVNSTLGSIDITQPRTEYEPSVYNLILMSLNQSSHLTGGAISLHNSTMLITNTTLEDNAALLGGALYAENSSLTISNGSALIGNLAFSGGALFAVGSSVMITDGRYMDNAANGSGGALCIGLLTVCHIENVDFERNTASYGGALYAHSFTDVTVASRGSFTNCHSFNGGAAIALTAHSSATVNNSILLNNTARIGGALYTEQSNLTLSDSTLNYNFAALRGSVLYSRSFSNVIINGCLLNDNIGRTAGVYFNHSRLQVIDSEISGNNYGYGFAIESAIELLGENIISDNCGTFVAVLSNMTIRGHTLFVNNNIRNECRETDRDIINGGAVTSFISDVFVFGKVNFSSNVAQYGGAIISWESKLHFWTGEIIFQDNYAMREGGAIYVYESKFEFRRAHCLFDRNFAEESGGAINLVSSTVNIFRDSLVVFTENVAKLGGAIFLELGSKMTVSKTNAHDNINVSFSHNHAYYGGALYVTDDTNSGTCAASSESLVLSFSNFIAASECFFQILALYSFSSVPNPLYKHMYFSNNLAYKAGNSLFGGLLDRCHPSLFSEFSILHLNREVSGTKYILETTDIKGEDVYSDGVRLCFCENGTPNCNYVPTGPWVVTKGVSSILPIVAVDQFNHTVQSRIFSYFSSQSDFGRSRLGGQNIQVTYGNCSDLKFKIQSDAETENLTLFAAGPCADFGISSTTIEIEFVDCICPVGFKIAMNNSEVCRCDCGQDLIENLGGENQCVITQNDQDNLLQRDSNFWIGTLNDSAPYHNECLAFFRYCPFDYCFRPESVHIEFNLNTSQITDSDMQCNGNRTGALCGSCRDGFSLALGSSKCLPNSTCTNSYIALVLAFALAGVVLVAFIMFFNLTVAVGTMNGLIFYANIIITTRVNNNFSQSNSGIVVNPLTIFITWLNLDLGIESCFHQGMDGLIKVGWQFVFPLYVLLLVVLVIFLCERSQRFANFLSGRNAVATLATLILFSYLKFLRIIIDAFTPAKVHLICPDGREYSQRRWYYDGNKYFDPGHIVIFLAALVVLVLGVVYTLILLTGQWFGKLSECPGLKWLCGQKLNHFLEPYSAPYIPKHRYWTGLLLLARILSCIISTITTDSGVPEGNLFSITMIATVLLLWKLIVGGRIYQNLLVDILESFFLVLLIVYGNAAQFILSYSEVLQPLALFHTLTTIALIIFILILLYHGYIYVLLPTSAGERFNMWITKKLNDGKHWFKETSCWKRFRSVKPETTEFEEANSPFSRGQQSFYSLQDIYSLERNRKKRSQPKKGSQLKKKQQEVTYSTVDIDPAETPLSEELGHYSKRMATLRTLNQTQEHFGSQEEVELLPVLSVDHNKIESCKNADNSTSADLECSTELNGNNVEIERCDSSPNFHTKSAAFEMNEEGVKFKVQVNGTPAELPLGRCDKSENHEFSTSYKLIIKDN